jgi:hypothetical protein
VNGLFGNRTFNQIDQTARKYHFHLSGRKAVKAEDRFGFCGIFEYYLLAYAKLIGQTGKLQYIAGINQIVKGQKVYYEQLGKQHVHETLSEQRLFGGSQPSPGCAENAIVNSFLKLMEQR